mgnify:CR=1 FL=1
MGKTFGNEELQMLQPHAHRMWAIFCECQPPHQVRCLLRNAPVYFAQKAASENEALEVLRMMTYSHCPARNSPCALSLRIPVGRKTRRSNRVRL